MKNTTKDAMQLGSDFSGDVEAANFFAWRVFAFQGKYKSHDDNINFQFFGFSQFSLIVPWLPCSGRLCLRSKVAGAEGESLSPEQTVTYSEPRILSLASPESSLTIVTASQCSQTHVAMSQHTR